MHPIRLTRLSRLRAVGATFARLRARAGQESGAVIVIVAGCMVLLLVTGAFAIDLGSGRQAEAHAQLAADAAAEAAADAIETGASATTAATSIASQNGYASSQVTVVYPYSGSSSQVQVKISATGDAEFAREQGTSAIPVSASAIAAVNTTVTTTTGTATNTVTNTVTNTTSQTVTNTSTGTVTSQTCSAAGGKCLAIYAAATTSCGGDSGDSSDPVVLGGGVSISGGVWSNGSINLGGGGSTFGNLTYNKSCQISPTGTSSPPSYQQNSNTFNGGYPAAATPLTNWPLDYSVDFPSCSGSSCTGPSGTPSWCTKASTASSWSIDTYNSPYTLVTGQIYCAVGSGTASKPTTWTGSLTISGGSSSIYSTFVAGSLTINGGTTLHACGYNLPNYAASQCGGSVPTPSTPNYPLFVAENGTVNESSGGNGLTGDWFVPNGSITVGGGTSFVGFLEAQTVNLSSGGIQGDGPADNGTSVGSTSTTTSTSTSVSTGTTTSLTSTTSTTVTSGSSTSTNGSKLVG